MAPARFPYAQFGATAASPKLRQFGTKSGHVPPSREYVSYFSRNIAAGKKIVSLGPTSSRRSTDHDDFLDLTGRYGTRPGARAAFLIGPVFAGCLGGRRRGDFHRPRRRGHLPARSVVTFNVLCAHR